MPRKFEEGEILYDEEDEVPEIYFILEGSVGVGFRLGGVGRPFKLIKQMRDRTFICDFYMCNNNEERIPVPSDEGGKGIRTPEEVH